MLSSRLDQIRELAALRASGDLTDEEFNQLKSDLFNNAGSASAQSPSSSNRVSQNPATEQSSTSTTFLVQNRPTSTAPGRTLIEGVKPTIIQATLHHYFGASTITSASGSQFARVDPPMTVNAKQFTCKICNKLFLTKAALLSHERIHEPNVIEDNRSLVRPENRRGSVKRHRLTFHQKAELIAQVNKIMVEEMVNQSKAITSVSLSSGFSYSTVYAILRKQDVILNMAASKKFRSQKSMFNRPFVKSLRLLEERLAIEIRQRRRLGLGVCCRWALSRARELRRMPNIVSTDHAPLIGLSRTWYYRGFIERNGFSIRRGSNRRQKPITELLSEAFKFHASLFKVINQQPFADQRWGHFSPNSVFNFDQVPLPFVCDSGKRTVDDSGANRVWLRQPGSGLDKRQATLHLTLCAGGGSNQPKPIIIFRGSGKNILKSTEVHEWDPRVSVLFQKCAWVDTAVCVSIAQLYKKDPIITKSNSPRLFICDNLDAQLSSDFTSAMSGLGALFYLPPNMTSELQPVDAGPGRFIKHQMGVELDQCLDQPRFREKWVDGKFSARERRVLITQWVASAFEKLCKSGSIMRYFEKTGCILHVNGEKNKINLQGHKGYTFDGGHQGFLINLDSSDQSDDDGDSSSETDNALGDAFSDGDDPGYSEVEDSGLCVDHNADDTDEDDIPISHDGRQSKIPIETWETINEKLHNFNVEAESNPSKWAAGSQADALAMLEAFLLTDSTNFLARMHAERLRTPIEELIELYEFKQRTHSL